MLITTTICYGDVDDSDDDDDDYNDFDVDLNVNDDNLPVSKLSTKMMNAAPIFATQYNCVVQCKAQCVQYIVLVNCSLMVNTKE